MTQGGETMDSTVYIISDGNAYPRVLAPNYHTVSIRELITLKELIERDIAEYSEEAFNSHRQANEARYFYDNTESAGKFPKKLFPGYVYLMRDDSGLFKIGATSNLTKRLEQLKSANPSLQLLLFGERLEPMVLERQLHEHFADKRVHGEWFKLEETDIALLGGILRDEKLPS